MNKVLGLKSFSKVAVTLFRLLHKESEYVVKSLTGRPSKSGDKKNPNDQDKLCGIYRTFSFLSLYLSSYFHAFSIAHV